MGNSDPARCLDPTHTPPKAEKEKSQAMQGASSASTWGENLMFWRQFLRNPQGLGAVLPSSRYLARAMAQEALAALHPDDIVLELGAGTGRFSRALLAQGLAANRLICLELNPELASYLRAALPAVTVIQGSACVVDQLIPPALWGRIGVVLSGLPMLNFSPLTQSEILRACWRVLHPDGVFLQFTYSPTAYLQPADVPLIRQCVGRVWRNIPPARIWQYKRPNDYEANL